MEVNLNPIGVFSRVQHTFIISYHEASLHRQLPIRHNPVVLHLRVIYLHGVFRNVTYTVQCIRYVDGRSIA